MIIKVQDDNLVDKHLVEAAYIQWVDGGPAYVVLEVYIVADRTKSTGSIAVHNTSIEEHPSLRLRIYHGDRVFIMNDEGKTIDAKRIDLKDEVALHDIEKERDRERGFDPKLLNQEGPA
jgi:hypothetical protein